ncbi:MAG: hypothetical protein CL946_13685 [Ectothiorhodospiraceae bacterium]|nr:hypothetical protein [Ectothiorhodospiraceae bacterium]
MKYILSAILFAFPLMAYGQLAPDKIHIGGGAGITFPSRNFQDTHNTGYLFQAVDEMKISGLFSIAGHLGLYQFPGDEISGTNDVGETIIVSYNNANVFVLTQGARVHFDNVIFGLEAGAFVGNEISDDISLFPMAGIQIGNFQVDARYKLTGSFDWFTLSASYYLFEF